MIKLTTPIKKEDIVNLKAGDRVLISGKIFCGRDAVLPKIVAGEVAVDLEGSVIFHTAVSPAGVGPTSSNKLEIEESMGPLSEMGVRLHLGKGAISASTIKALNENDSVFAVIPPVTALLEDKTISKEMVAFPELGMEALHKLEVKGYPAIIAAAHGRSIYDR